jgi:hypothetical protein
MKNAIFLLALLIVVAGSVSGSAKWAHCDGPDGFFTEEGNCPVKIDNNEGCCLCTEVTI